MALRFLSPDPVDVSGTNGSNFNRYWYAANNPMKYRDPDGRESKFAQQNPWFKVVHDDRMSVSDIRESEEVIDRAAPRVFGTVRGSELRQMVIESKEGELTVVTNNRGDNSSVLGSFELTVDVYSYRVAETENGRQRASFESILAHEIGHAVAGTPDTNMENVQANENPIRRELNEPERVNYE